MGDQAWPLDQADEGSSVTRALEDMSESHVSAQCWCSVTCGPPSSPPKAGWATERPADPLTTAADRSGGFSKDPNEETRR